MKSNKIIIKESSVIGILGRRGGGKSTLLAKIGEDDYLLGKTIITNFWVSYPHIEMTFEEIVLLPKVLRNATVLLDENQVGAGSRRALTKNNQFINKFITQLRKRNIVLYYGTQNFKFVDVDIRNQTDFLIISAITDIDNIYKIIVVDRNDFTDSAFGSVINIFEYDATDLYLRNVFNTDQIINFGEEE